MTQLALDSGSRPRHIVGLLKEQGFATVPALFGPDSLAAILDECDCLLETRCTFQETTIADQLCERGCVLETLPECSDEARSNKAKYANLRGAWPLSRAVCAKLTHGELFNLAHHLLGPQCYLYNDQYIVKPPRSGTSGFAWHFDSQWLPNDVELHPYISIWVALDDVDEANGCLHIWPRSHLQQEKCGAHSAKPALKLLRHEEAVKIRMKAGGAVR
ncbi:hypothetical protein WJX84_011270 [Apatococcus fuscideae]|uniref:Phytanoyl-CoA dioxygenase family protein n=1 Tax=Apatococcus fuscideae TaxID=2026836 RepID=A0AAW1SYH3_9CHLO